VLGIDERDVAAVLVRVQAIPSHPIPTPGSGIDWRALFQGIRDRYATRLEVLQSVLVEDASARRAFRFIEALLMPYRLHSAVPPPTGSDMAFAEPIFHLCATSHTLFTESATLTASEHLLLNAARETNREICRTLVGMWADGMLPLRDSAPASLPMHMWRAEVDRLMD